MSRKVIINKLMLDTSLVGYRFDIMDEGNRKISFDLQKSIAKAFLSLLDRNNVYKGKLINGSLHDGRYLTDNEEDVVEIVNKNQAVKALRDYYYCADEQSIEDLLESDFGNQVDKLDNEEYKFILAIAVRLPQSVGHAYVASYKSLSSILAECSLPYLIFADRNDDNGFVQYRVGNNVSEKSLLSVIWEYFRRGNVLHTELYLEGKNISISVGNDLSEFLSNVSGNIVFADTSEAYFLGDGEILGVFLITGTITVTKGTNIKEVEKDTEKWLMKLGNIEDDGSMDWEEFMVEIPPKDPTVLEVIDLFISDQVRYYPCDIDKNLMLLSYYRPWYFRVNKESSINWSYFGDFCNNSRSWRTHDEYSQNIEKNLNMFYPYTILTHCDSVSYVPEFNEECFDYCDLYLSREVYSFPKLITSLIEYILERLDLDISIVKDDFFYQGFNIFCHHIPADTDYIFFYFEYSVSHKYCRHSGDIYKSEIVSSDLNEEFYGKFNIKGISKSVVLDIVKVVNGIVEKSIKKTEEFRLNISVLRGDSVIDKKVYKQDISSLRKFFAEKKPSIFKEPLFNKHSNSMAFIATSREFEEEDNLDWSKLTPTDKTIKTVDLIIDSLKTEFVVTEKNVSYLEGSPVVNSNIFCKYSVIVKNQNMGVSDIYGFEAKLPLIVRRVFDYFRDLFTTLKTEYEKAVKCSLWRLGSFTVERNSTGLCDISIAITSLPKYEREFKYSYPNFKLDDLCTTEYLNDLFVEMLHDDGWNFNDVSALLYVVSLLPIIIKNSGKIFNTCVSKISFIKVSCITPHSKYDFFEDVYCRSDFKEFVGTTGNDDIVYILFPKKDIDEWNEESIF